MKHWFSFMSVIFLLGACGGKDKLPAGALSMHEMQEVMWDMVRAGEFLNGYIIYKDSAMDRVAESQKWHKKVYQLHGISEEKFMKSLTYYEKRPELMKIILDSLSRKPVYARAKDSASSAGDADSTQESASPSIDTRIRTVDSVDKRRLLQKVFKGK